MTVWKVKAIALSAVFWIAFSVLSTVYHVTWFVLVLFGGGLTLFGGGHLECISKPCWRQAGRE